MEWNGDMLGYTVNCFVSIPSGTENREEAYSVNQTIKNSNTRTFFFVVKVLSTFVFKSNK